MVVLLGIENERMLKNDRFEYIEKGSGPTLLLLHGLFGELSNFDGIINHFSKDHHILVPRLPILDSELKDTHLDFLTDYLEQFVAYKSLGKISLVGNSLGGHIALIYTLRHPKIIDKLILTGSSGLFEQAMGDSFPRKSDYEFVKIKTAETFYDPEVATKRLVDHIYEVVNDRGKLLRIIRIARNTIQVNLRDKLPSIQQQTLLIWGNNDTITPAFVGDEFNELIPNSELHFIDKCGHAAMMEHPTLFNKIMQNFLEKHA